MIIFYDNIYHYDNQIYDNILLVLKVLSRQAYYELRSCNFTIMYNFEVKGILNLKSAFFGPFLHVTFKNFGFYTFSHFKTQN